MSPLVELDSDVLDYLKSQAEPFVDTPSTVLRRLLELAEPNKQPAALPAELPPGPARARSKKAKGRSSNASNRRARGRKRAPSGTLLSEKEYERPLLQALIALGGEAPYRDVREAVGKEIEGLLMPADSETLASGSIRWHSRLQFVRLRLIERGEMDRDAPRGIWRITDEGRKALKACS